MKHRIVAGLACVVLGAPSVGTLGADQGGANVERPAQFGRPRATAGTNVVAGRVFDAGTNAPVRRAQVVALNDLEDAVLATTDDEGRFELRNLSAGNWRVTASKNGYFKWQLGQRRPFERPPPITLFARQHITAEIPLSRGGVIAGRVHDETGEALAGLRVTVYRARMTRGYRRLEAIGAADRTDDTGAYRIYGLPPGDYYVAASLRVAPPDSLVETTYAPTYYPGTGELAEAQRVRLGLGAEASAGFPLLPIRHVRVSGVVLTSAGGPANAFLNLTSEAAEFGVPFGIGGVTKEDGSFALPDVPPGRYTLNASLRGDGPSEIASIPLTVGTDDMTATTLVTGTPPRMRGRFVADAGVSRGVPEGLDVIATAARAGGTVLNAGSGSAFELAELSEPFYLRVDGLPEGLAVKAIVVNDVDVTDTRITLAPGQEAEARIVLTDRAAEVNGTIAVRGQPRKVNVVVFPEDATKWTYPWRLVRMAQTDDRGRFRIAGLPSGERYLALATDYLEDEEHNDPEFLARMREFSVPFQVDASEKRTLDLPVTER